MKFPLTGPPLRPWFLWSVVGLWALCSLVVVADARPHELPDIGLDLSDPSTFNVLSEPFALDRGEPLPDDLLLGLVERSGNHASTLEMFTCTETVEKAGGSGHPLEYLLGVAEDRRFEIEEIRFKGEHRSTRASKAVPPPAAWATLFSDLNRPYFVYRYLGIRVRGYAPVHAILFRGSLWFTGGTDIREWEGVAYVDPVTLDPLFVEAAPRLHAERAKEKAKKRNRSLRLSFSLNKVPIPSAPTLRPTRRWPAVSAVTVEFAKTTSGRALPSEVTRYRHRFSDSGVTEKFVEVRRYADYRFFDTRTDERIGGIR